MSPRLCKVQTPQILDLALEVWETDWHTEDQNGKLKRSNLTKTQMKRKGNLEETMCKEIFSRRPLKDIQVLSWKMYIEIWIAQIQANLHSLDPL